MVRKVIDIGVIGNDGTGDSIRDSFAKVNENFRELYGSLGLGEKLSFIDLEDTPITFVGQAGAVPAVNPDQTALQFKQIVSGIGINVDTTTNPNQIAINSLFNEIVSDPDPKLGGNLSARSSGEQWRILDLTSPTSNSEAANKAYVDTKIAKSGVDTVDPATGRTDSGFGRMTGPLILSRSPIDDDDLLYDGLIAATKEYVDNGGFASTVNLYVSTSGADERPTVSDVFQGRSLASAYRTLEAALKRAEEIMLESELEIGPYKKVLTYGKNESPPRNEAAILVSSTDLEGFGSGFSGVVNMSVDRVTLTNPGANYQVGDILTLSGTGFTGSPARLEVLSTATTPGQIVTFRIVSGGLYTALPGTVNVSTDSNSEFGGGARFNVTYKVNRITNIIGGSGYSLVSVRVTGGGGTGAFGTAIIEGESITDIVITDQGSGFTAIPSLQVSLPRFTLKTEFQRTDYTGDVTTDTIQAIRGRDVREGLFLRGETSGAIAQILAHEGALDSDGNEIFDVDIKSGEFIIGEAISYGDRAAARQVCIFVEAGIYEEHFPLKISNNVAIIGDEFRRTIVRPKSGTSSSPWAFDKFRRDLTIGSPPVAKFVYDDDLDNWFVTDTQGDLIQIADRIFGYHYLSNTGSPVLPKINNAGNYIASANLINVNRVFLQRETLAWVNFSIFNGVNGFSSTFGYVENVWERLFSDLLRSLTFDLKYGRYNRTVSSALKIFEDSDNRLVQSTQLSQFELALDYLKTLILSVISNTEITDVYQQNISQIIDTAFLKRSGADDVVEDLFSSYKLVIEESGSANLPKENDQLDMFLCNDANIIRAITGQGHGGFMMVLDPTGQVLAKSPYCQESASFSKSINSQIFAGGMFVDGFTGNLQFTHESTELFNGAATRIAVSGLDRFPELPASFIVNDTVHRINYIRNFTFDPNGSSALFVLDETTPFNAIAGQRTCTVATGSPGVFTLVEHEFQGNSTVRFTSSGTLPSPLVAGRDYYISSAGITTNTFSIVQRPGDTNQIEITTGGTGVLRVRRIYEVLMPGNRSMLSNDYTQINDLGYGLVATNGGLTEAVSMFTYYCYISYYSINGGQIRSVGGSSAHGRYALVAEGSDPLEVPTPTGLYFDLAQKIVTKVESEAEITGASQGGKSLYVTGWEYTPLPNSELEIDHGGFIVRYPVTSVTPISDGVVLLSISSENSGDNTETNNGFAEAIGNNEVHTLRQNSTLILTGNLRDVAVRPSTGLVLNESGEVYRVLEFADYQDFTVPDYRVRFAVAEPTDINVLLEITTDGSDTITSTDRFHQFRIDEQLKTTPDLGTGTSGLTADTVYYIVDVVSTTEFKISTTLGGTAISPSVSTAFDVYVPHKFDTIDQVAFTSSLGIGSLPSGLIDDPYFVSGENLTTYTFRITDVKNGNTIGVTDAGGGVLRYRPVGITRTRIRENYNYSDLPVYKPGEFKETPRSVTITVSEGNPLKFTESAPHGLSQGDVIKFETDGDLPPPLTTGNYYFVFDANPDSVSPAGNSTTFTVSVTNPNPGFSLDAQSIQPDPGATQTGNHVFGKILGEEGDDLIPVVAVSSEEQGKVQGATFNFKGENYIVTQYQGPNITGEPYARLLLNRPLKDSIIQYGSAYVIKSAATARTVNATGTLTIRISLTRVTSHDLLEIGTGSYADTNYPNEIFGGAVNPISEADEVQERDVGRCFYVTTDQYGNFKVGPYFKVDQGTGQVTFSSQIALSNLDGIGFKRGVPISEFSIETGFDLSRIDTVPTEFAVREYIDRRLGASHTGEIVDDADVIPPLPRKGGFMALSGVLSMGNDMNLGGYHITNLKDPINDDHAVNLRSLTVENFQDFVIDHVESNDILLMTGSGSTIQNAAVVGDISLDIDSSAHTVDAQINPGVILDNDVNSEADIAQSKLLMNLAGTSALNPVGTAREIQAANGLASFNNAEFTVVNGWVSMKSGGTGLDSIQQILPGTVLGNSTGNTATVSEVSFSTIVNQGSGVKKGQYSTTGFLRRLNSESFLSDADFQVVESAASYNGSADNGKLVQRDSNGDFGARNVSVNRLIIDGVVVIDASTTSDGGATELWTFNNKKAIICQDGTVASSRKNQYRNDIHEFYTSGTDSTNFAPIKCSSIEAQELTTGASGTSGTVTGSWTLTASSKFEATYAADLAEYYEGDREYEAGTVLVFGGDKEVTTSNIKEDTRVAGVVSDNAAYTMYAACPGLKNLIALQGRVPCRVVGKISKGDLLTSSGIPGVAGKVEGTAKTGTIIGKALENYDNDHIGMIQVAVGRS